MGRADCMSLTRDSEKAFKIIFCEYKRLRKAGFTKDDSRQFKSGSIYKIDAFSNWLRPDIDSALREIESAGFIKENIIGDITISNEGIKYMEDKPKEFFGELSGLFDLVSLFR